MTVGDADFTVTPCIGVTGSLCRRSYSLMWARLWVARIDPLSFLAGCHKR